MFERLGFECCECFEGGFLQEIWLLKGGDISLGREIVTTIRKAAKKVALRKKQRSWDFSNPYSKEIEQFHSVIDFWNLTSLENDSLMTALYPFKKIKPCTKQTILYNGVHIKIIWVKNKTKDY